MRPGGAPHCARRRALRGAGGARRRATRCGTAGAGATAVVAGGPAPAPGLVDADPGRAPWPSRSPTPRIATVTIGTPASPNRRRSRGAVTAGPSRSKCSSKSRSSPGGASPASASPAGTATPRRSRSSRQSERSGNSPVRARSAHSRRPLGGSSDPSAAAHTAASTRWPSPGATAARPPPACSNGRSRNGVGPGPTATSASAAASGEKPAAATRSASRPKASVRRAASSAVGRRSMRQRSTGRPRLGGRTRNQRSPWRPKSSTPQTSLQPMPHQRATVSARPASSHSPPANTIRTCAPRPDCVSSASTGPKGRAASAAGLVRYRSAMTWERGAGSAMSPTLRAGGVTGQHPRCANFATNQPDETGRGLSPVVGMWCGGLSPVLPDVQVRAWKIAVVTSAPSTPP